MDRMKQHSPDIVEQVRERALSKELYESLLSLGSCR
jgi:hypothetical protein